MDDRWQGWEVGGQRDGSDGGNGAGESLEQLGLLNVEDRRREGITLVVDLGDSHSVGERRDAQHVEEGGLGGSDLGSSLDKLQVDSNLNGTTGNLCRDAEGLEERGLSGLHTSVSSRDIDICGRNGTGSGGSCDLVGVDLVTDGLEITVGEDESDVALDEWEETLVLGVVADEALDGTANLRGLAVATRGLRALFLAYHGVLSHQDDSLSAERLTDLVHLLRADIVDTDDEDGVVFLEQALELLEVAELVCGFAPHIFLEMKLGV